MALAILAQAALPPFSKKKENNVSQVRIRPVGRVVSVSRRGTFSTAWASEGLPVGDTCLAQAPCYHGKAAPPHLVAHGGSWGRQLAQRYFVITNTFYTFIIRPHRSLFASCWCELWGSHH